MRTPLFASALLFACACSGFAEQPSKASPNPVLDSKAKKEIVAAEKALAGAIEKRNAAALASILADYFADAEGEGERATNKAAMLQSCDLGSLSSYRFGNSPRYSQSGEMVIVQGIAQASKAANVDSPPAERTFRVRRLWTQKDGRWVLVVQERRSLDEDRADHDAHKRKP
ncbi:MAG: nuclear transport factor 2 family protein [Verrucomicrobiota bacterium]|nr:nuclear transport factor 2 family protein [Verrucomicrobiota bacterium]